MIKEVQPAEDQDFRWVKAVRSCSAFEVFKLLQGECAQDVEDRNEIRSGAEQRLVIFAISAHGGKFLVTRQGTQISSSVRFECRPASIVVLDDDEHVFLEASLAVNDLGECRLRVGEDELTRWQFRRRALHDLFFRWSFPAL